MTELQGIFLVLAVLYGWECLCWLRRGNLALRSWRGTKWKLLHPGSLAGNHSGGVVWGHPVPPLGTLLCAGQSPLSISAAGAFAYVATNLHPAWRPAQSECFIRFEAIKEVAAAQSKLLVNGALLVRCASPHQAAMLARRLRELAKLPENQRAGVIRKALGGSFDTEAIRQRLEEFRQVSQPVRKLANALFLYVFVVCPLLFWQVGLRNCWLPVAVVLLGFTVTTAIYLRRAHRALYPLAEDERFTVFLTALLSPPSAMRAVDALSRPLLQAFHPLAVAQVLCSPAQFRAFAQVVVRDTHHPAHPVCPVDNEAARATEAGHRAALRETMDEFLNTHGLAVAELLKPPAPADASCRQYCPRCLAQFTESAADCADCGGLALEPLETRPAAASAIRSG
ncbi:MAG: hypothetical protein AB1705_05500 [Verrucomicrobiota bacterium]